MSATPIINITSKEQFDKLINDTPYVALQASAEWCGPCKAVSPFFNKHADALNIPDKYAFARFDIEAVEDLTQELGIKSIPAFLFFEKGDKAESVIGTKPAELKKAVDGFSAKAKGGDAVSA